jgi:hypothetical protein
VKVVVFEPVDEVLATARGVDPCAVAHCNVLKSMGWYADYLRETIWRRLSESTDVQVYVKSDPRPIDVDYRDRNEEAEWPESTITSIVEECRAEVRIDTETWLEQLG